jgi:hypothetical protein
MEGLRIAGVFAVIPTAVLLTISFFVLFTIRKTETQGVKAFGYVVAALLWLSALLVFSVGVYTLSSGRPLVPCPMMQKMMSGQKEGMMGMGKPMMPGQNKGMIQDQEMMKSKGAGAGQADALSGATMKH